MKRINLKYKLIIEGRDENILCEQNKTILQALIAGGVFLEANCSGRGTCGNCKIQILQGEVSDEDGYLLKIIKNNTYQACQLYPLSNIIIRLKNNNVSQKAQTAEIVLDDNLPLLKKIILRPCYPTVNNHYSLQEMIREAIAAYRPIISDINKIAVLDDATFLRQLNAVAVTKPKQLTITLLADKVIAIEAEDTTKYLYGVAFDIGTTTVVGMMVDLNTKKIVAVCSENNPQASMGADVISRIQAAQAVEGGLKKLSQLIRQCLNQIIIELCSKVGIRQEHVYAVTIAGNATMVHLVLNISPVSLVHEPYAALFKYIAPVGSQELAININKQGKIIILPSIASFIGSDTTAAILAVDQDISPTPVLMVDLGTNGEIVIGDSEKLYACSTAAGPAFEGAHIRDGMRAADGAISDVIIKGQEVLLQVIGNGKPAGICGSGLIKAAAELLKAEILHESGRFNRPESLNSKTEQQIGQRLQKQDDGHWEFVLSKGENNADGKDISLTQDDVRQLQLVKSSISTGIQILREKYDSGTQLKVCLAGAFGNYLDIESALTIGLLPGIKREDVVSVGNAAGTGAVQVLLSAIKLQRCMKIVQKVEFVELAAQPEFQKRFLTNLTFK